MSSAFLEPGKTNSSCLTHYYMFPMVGTLPALHAECYPHAQFLQRSTQQRLSSPSTSPKSSFQAQSLVIRILGIAFSRILQDVERSAVHLSMSCTSAMFVSRVAPADVSNVPVFSFSGPQWPWKPSAHSKNSLSPTSAPNAKHDGQAARIESARSKAWTLVISCC